MDQDNYTSQEYANVNVNVNAFTLSSFFSNLNNNTNENDIEDDNIEDDNMPSLVSLNTQSLYDTSFMTASNMLTQIQQQQSSLFYNNLNSFISNSNIHPQLHNHNHYLNNSNINSQLSGPTMMNNYLNHYISNSIPINNPNTNNFINNNIYPFNMLHQENILGLNGTTGMNNNMMNGPSNNIMINGNFNQTVATNAINGNFNQYITPTHGMSGSNGPTMFHGMTNIPGNVTIHGPFGIQGNSTIHGPSGASGSNGTIIYGPSGSNMSGYLNNKVNHKLSFVDDNFHFISNCLDKSDISKGILYKFKYKNIKLEFVLRINESNRKPIYNKKFLKMIKIIESIINNMNESENIRSICNIIYHKDYYISLSIKSKINIVI